MTFAPVVVLGVLEGWAAVDLLSLPGRLVPALALLFLANLIVLALGVRFHWAPARWVSLVLLGATYVVAHALALGVYLIHALLFIVLIIAYVEIKILADRFAPVLETAMESAQRTQVMAALRRTSARLAVALVFAVLVPLLAAELAVAAVFPVASVSTLLLLAAAFLAIVVLIALYPALGRSTK